MKTVSLGTLTEIDVDRYNQLHQMVQFLGTRKNYFVRQESFMEGMCHHFTLLEGKAFKPVAKIVNEFNKHFSLVEYGGIDVHATEH